MTLEDEQHQKMDVDPVTGELRSGKLAELLKEKKAPLMMFKGGSPTGGRPK